MSLRRSARSVVAVAAGVALCAVPPSAGAATSTRQQQTCPIVGADPDTVTLTGPAVLTPADRRYVGYTLTAAETPSEKGDGLPHGITVSYSVKTEDRATSATTGAVPASGHAQGDFSVPVHFRLRADRNAGGTGRRYLISWTASFDGGPHTCTSTDSGRSAFVVVVPHDQGRAFHAQGITSWISGHTVAVNDTDGDATLRGRTVSTYVASTARIRRDGATARLSALRAGDRITVSGTRDRHGRLIATSVTALSPPQPDAAAVSVGGSCANYYTDCTPTLPPATGGPHLDITISNFAYDPPATIVPLGTIVTVHNLDGFAHTFSASHLDSGPIAGGAAFTVEFTRPGMYRFFCSIHPFMNGVLEAR